MSGVRRFLSTRQGNRHRSSGDHVDNPPVPRPFHLNKPAFSKSSPELISKAVDPNSAADFYGLFDAHVPPATHSEEQKIKTLRQKIINNKGVMLRDAQILWALRSIAASGDVDAAYSLLLALSDASEGIVTPYDPRVKLLGAQNRQGVTCFLDATLFSMFSRLDSFEAMLYNSFDDVSRNKLGFVLRIWVNLLRSGKLITTDITKVLQDTIAECGWKEAGELHQQDASEAFTFITGMLELPLLTLKMDIYHTGKEDTTDDHKFINERLLEVAIPPDTTGERNEVTLEDCLEDYFNNRIEVRRYLERRSTLNSIRKSSVVHVETVEVDSDSSPVTPLSPPSSSYASSTTRPPIRIRAPSIIQERYIPPRTESGYSSLGPVESKDTLGRSRTGSIRKEVMMPAWQFFSLIPWYTDNAPTNDAQVAAHFSTKRPILGLCLKRYSMTQNGKAVRLNTQIDIPVEIGVPRFIQDDQIEDVGGLHGNFKLSLQAAVCHRGNSVDSGHYIALVRGTPPPTSADGYRSDAPKTWMRFDDLAPQRITVIDIEKALREETAYLLFYQIVPIDGDPGQITIGEDTLASVSERNASISEMSSESVVMENVPASGRPSFEITGPDDPRGRSPTETRRASVISFQGQPPEYNSEASLSVPNNADSASISSSSKSLSRTQSKTSDGIGRTLSKLRRRSREVLPPPENPNQAEVHIKEISERTLTDRHHASPTSAPPTPKQQNNLRVETHHTKSHKREKSRNRISRSKMRGDRPDRECVVM